MTSVAVGWQIYDATGRAFDLGLVGLVQFIPQLLLFPVAGAVVDSLDRRRVLSAVSVCYLLCAGMLAALSTRPAPATVPIFAVLALLAVARTFSGPAAQATLPRLVTTEDLPVAVSWSSSSFSMAVVVGPALGGVAYALGGPTLSYLAAAACLIVALFATTRLPPVAPPKTGEPRSWRHMLEGIRFIRRKPILLAAMTLDLFAVLLGGAVALLPIYAKDILHAGPIALGVLRASPAIGATVTAVYLAHRPLQRAVGKTLLWTVAGFGLATLAFANATTLLPAALALACVGATDEVSVYIRMNIVQMSTPDALRGRVAAAEFVFIGASNELGEMESGFLAAWIGPVAAVTFGGVGAILVAATVAWLAPSLRTLNRIQDLRAQD
jgi:MFS family permease